jgi:glutamyl-tRNA synthetase
VRNYLCFLSTEFDESMIGWSLQDLVERFDVEKLGTSASIFDPEKLRWMNGRAIRMMSAEALGERLVAYLARSGFYGGDGPAATSAAGAEQQAAEAEQQAPPALPPASSPPVPPSADQERLTRAVAPLVQEKMDVLADFAPVAGWFFRPLAFAPEALERLRGTAGAAETLARAAAALRELPAWEVEAVEALVRELPQRLDLKPKAVFAALRLGMSGQAVTPGLFESLWVLGCDEAASRLEQAAALL